MDGKQKFYKIFFEQKIPKNSSQLANHLTAFLLLIHSPSAFVFYLSTLNDVMDIR